MDRPGRLRQLHGRLARLIHRAAGVIQDTLREDEDQAALVLPPPRPDWDGKEDENVRLLRLALYQWKMQGVRLLLDRAADGMEELRQSSELYAAPADGAWRDSAAGRRHREAHEKMRTMTKTLREMDLPNVGNLR